MITSNVTLPDLEGGNKNSSTKHPTKTVVKAKRGSQFMKKSKTKVVPFLGDCGVKANVSRRKPAANVLYAFPHFDKSDALLYFPNSLSKHINSGDFTAVGKLLRNHMDKQCLVSIFDSTYNMNAQSMVQMCEIMHELRPDFIMCVHSTKVVDNQIRASAYMKFTDVKQIYDSVAHSVTDPLFMPLFSQKREEKLRNGLKIGSPSRTEEEEQRLISLVEADIDILLYTAMDIVVTFNHVSKKIIGLNFVGRVTAIESVNKLK